MGIIIIIGIIVFIFFALAGKKKPNPSPLPPISRKQETGEESKAEMVENILKNIEITLPNYSSISNDKDDSIIDVTDQSYRINSITNSKKYSSSIPYWAHQYVYSYSEINSASNEQKKFYGFFKNKFLNGEYLDLEGNTNYAFILLFDLLNEYDNHNDISKLESQLKFLGQNYPRTKSYGISFLIDKMEKSSNSSNDLVERIIDEEYYSEYYNRKLGSKFKSKLNFSQREEELFNNITFSESKFSKIPIFSSEIFLLFYKLYNHYQIELNENGVDIEIELKRIANIIAKEKHGFTDGHYDPRFAIYREILNAIWKFSENIIRNYYGISLKVNPFSSYYVASSEVLLSEAIFSKLNTYLGFYSYKLLTLDSNTEIELNSIQNTRWKIKFEELTINYKDKPKEFVESIIELGKLNERNPSIENIFFESSKFMGKFDKASALTLYVYYLYHDLKSKRFNNKKLTKTIQKNLFKTNEQLHDFEKIVSELIIDKELEKAVVAVPRIYKVKRKKIRLDRTAIKEVQQQHSGTVELLNEYLRDDFEDENNAIKSEEINSEEIEIEITQKKEGNKQSTFLGELSFKPIHIATLELFSKNNLSILQSEIEVFAKSKSVFKNQLIESINENCFELLDDVLIEEEDDYYTINPEYFQEISTK